MNKIVIEHQCGCVKRSDLEIETTIECKDEALLKAIQMKDKMNSSFCQKHSFDLKQSENKFVLSFAQAKSCCGGSAC